MSLLVVGAGVAGTAAALAAARTGTHVTMVDGGAGASVLWTGGIDGVGVVSDEATAIASNLEVALGERKLVTIAGLLRFARGADAALLDAGGLAVGVAQCDRPGWDAGLVARAAGHRFFPIECAVLRHSDERVIPDADFAARHDEEGRLGWLAERLREGLSRAGGRVQALLLPPSLGIDRPRATALSRLVGLPCGEAVGMPGGVTGLRFEHARGRALAHAGVTVVSGRAVTIERVGTRFRVKLEDRDLEAEVVVVALGGLLGGGLEYQPSEAMLAAALPPQARPAFRCTVVGPLPLGAHGRPLDLPGSLFGVAPETVAWPLSRDALMDRVGVLCDDHGRVLPGLFAAGELVADAARTWLAALEGGARAGIAAAREIVRASPARPASLGAAPASRP